ncbi:MULTISPECIES: PRC-barrel domain-containing protein [unclassified Sulfitobacter]|uniref:PRC-barrel domain-containing protein n=1 Tax=unclassified Sulfitobacter TaxID=196795 RepID=UPI0037457E10
MRNAPLLAITLIGSLAATTLRSETETPQFIPQDTMIALSSLNGHKLFLPAKDEPLAEIDLEELKEPMEGWTMAGQVSEVVISRDGTLRGIIVDAGGFLGKGATRVLSLDDLRFLPDADEENEFFLLYTGQKEDLKSAPEYNEDDVRLRAADMREGGEKIEIVKLSDLDSEEFLGLAAFGQNDNWIGEISQVTFSEDGQIKMVILDIGGFLGLGETQVAVPLDMIELRRLGGDDLRAYVSATEKELQEMEPWKEDN